MPGGGSRGVDNVAFYCLGNTDRGELEEFLCLPPNVGRGGDDKKQLSALGSLVAPVEQRLARRALQERISGTWHGQLKSLCTVYLVQISDIYIQPRPGHCNEPVMGDGWRASDDLYLDQSSAVTPEQLGLLGQLCPQLVVLVSPYRAGRRQTPPLQTHPSLLGGPGCGKVMGEVNFL